MSTPTASNRKINQYIGICEDSCLLKCCIYVIAMAVGAFVGSKAGEEIGSTPEKKAAGMILGAVVGGLVGGMSAIRFSRDIARLIGTLSRNLVAYCESNKSPSQFEIVTGQVLLQDETAQITAPQGYQPPQLDCDQVVNTQEAGSEIPKVHSSDKQAR